MKKSFALSRDVLAVIVLLVSHVAPADHTREEQTVAWPMFPWGSISSEVDPRFLSAGS
jgi:hypothetical protein